MVDYIFGMEGISYFKNPTLSSTAQGYITAQGRTAAGSPGAYVFDNANLTLAGTAKANSMFLGRPWRSYSTVVFKNSDFGNAVDLRGWSNWQESDPRTGTVYYAEYNNRGASAWNNQRADFSRQIGKDEAGVRWSVKGTLGSDDWIDRRFL